MSSGYRTNAVREYAFPVAAVAAALLLPYQWVLWTFVAMGQAHFLITYIYQYKGKKMATLPYVAVAALYAAWFAWYVAGAHSYALLMLFIGGIFSVHFAIDEITLHDEAHDKEAIASIAAFSFLFAATLAAAEFSLAWLAPAAFAAAALVLAVRVLIGRRAPSAAERYLWLVGALLCAISAFLHNGFAMLAVIVTLHYLNWYVGFAYRVMGSGTRARQYWGNVAWTLALTTVGMALYATHVVPLLGVFFGLYWFFGWTGAHIFLSWVSAALRPAKR